MAEAWAITVGTDLAIEAVKALTKLVTSRAADKARLAWGSKDKFSKLTRKFEVMGAFLEDLSRSKQSRKSALVDAWVKRVMDAFYMADNVMDEYAYETVRRKLELKNRSFSQKFPNCFPLLSSLDVFFRFRMSFKVRDLLSLFDDLDKEAKDIGLNQVELARNAIDVSRCDNDNDNGWNQAREFASHSNGFVGREDDVNSLLEMLCNPGKNISGDDLSTVAIVGMGGFGKTALARRLYDHEKINTLFANKKHWICVSENFSIKRFLNEILESITSEKEELHNTDAIIGKLRKKMEDSKILLVLDDAWNDNKELWDSFKGSLRRIGVLPGSVILITTRSHEVAKNAGDASPHLLKELLSDESWALLKRNGFILPCQEEVGRRIIEKCNGVPLAIKVVGGLLQSRQHLYEWESIEKSELWDLPQGQNQILPSLMLSFNHLPSPSLKQCFAYFSIFPRRCEVPKSELICVWSSQGYLSDDKTRNGTLEEIGESYLKILLDNSLLQEKQDVSNYPCYRTYSMHELVYDLAVHALGNDLNKEAKPGSRHLVFSCEEDETTSESPSEKVLRKLRTIFLAGNVQWNLLIQAKYLRTLFLSRTGITEVPPCIDLLKHLRFLDVSYNPIRTLPDSIAKLYLLETLVLEGCEDMRVLPKVVNKLVNLRHILTSKGMYAWKGLKELTLLQSLPPLILHNNRKGCTIDELGELPGLSNEIIISSLECVKDKEEARKAGLSRKKNVSKLTFYWSDGRECRDDVSDEDVLDGLEPHPYITSLELKNFMGKKFPTWITRMTALTEEQSVGLGHLTSVKLLDCNKCQTLPTLGQLPYLKELILSGFDVDCIGKEFYGDDNLHAPTMVSFRCLKELVILDFPRLTTWVAPLQEAFPNLEVLLVRNCPCLEGVPALRIKSLHWLDLMKLDSVKSLDIIKYSIGLTTLGLGLMPGVRRLPVELAHCKKLQELKINGLQELLSLPDGLESLAFLQSLKLRCCPGLTFLPDDLFRGPFSLLEFQVYDCAGLRTIPSSLEGCRSLKSLAILKCPLITSPPTNFSMLERLTTFGYLLSSSKASNSRA